MTSILAADLHPDQTYKLMTGVVVPRPIAWVCTRSLEGVLNLAPFSAFTFLSYQPPMLGISIARRNGSYKDTARNIHATGEYVVHIGDASMIELIHESGRDHPPEVSEVELLRMEVMPSDRISVPRLAAPPVSMECRLDQVLSFGKTGSEFIVGEVLAFHVQDALLRNGKIDSVELNPACRLAGPNYGTLGRVVTLRAL